MASTSLIVTIVRKGWGSTVMAASVEAGAGGGTVLFGRGAGVNEQDKLFGMSIEPEKEILLTLTFSDRVEPILAAIVKAADLGTPGRGVAFVVPVDAIAGAARLITQRREEEERGGERD